MGEFTEILPGGGIVSAGGFFWCLEESEIDPTLVNLYVSSPAPIHLNNAFKMLSQFLVGIVLSSRAWSKVLSTVIQAVTVFVVGILIFKSGQNAMHQDCGSAFFHALLSVGVDPVAISYSCPIPLIEEIVISGINDNVVASSERYEFDRLILRLENCVAFHVALHKKPPFLMRHSAAFRL